MYDDYDYKLTKKRIQFKFTQDEDIPIYPWEIAKFLDDLNTNYYKYELLNSISTALVNGIKPENIILLDKSLPLYRKYSNFDIFNLKNNCLQLFYNIGNPIALAPSFKTEELRLHLAFFRKINSKLAKNGFRPLFRNTLPGFHLASIGQDAEVTIDNMMKLASTRDQENRSVNDLNFNKEVKYFKTNYNKLTDDFKVIKTAYTPFKDTTLKNIEPKICIRYFEQFLIQFKKLSRPLICIRKKNNFRVLGRSLINKSDKRVQGLELLEVSRNSPLGSLFEGGATVYRTIQQEKRAKELHEEELEIKKLEKKLLKEKITQEQFKTFKEKILLGRALDEIAKNSDVSSHEQLGKSFYEQQILDAYITTDMQSQTTLDKRGFKLLPENTKIIDVEA